MMPHPAMLSRFAVLLAVAAAAAQQAPLPSAAAVAPIAPAELRLRREALARAIATEHPDRAAIVLLRGGAKPADMGAFVQDQDFLYLTGVAEPDVAMLLVVGADGTLQRDALLVPPYSPFAAKWDGRFLAPGDEAAQRTGFREVGNVRALDRELDALLGSAAAETRPVLVAARAPAARLGSTPGKASQTANAMQKDPLDGRASREQALLDHVTTAHPGLDTAALEPFVHAMRVHKSPAEAALLRRSAEIAADGIAEAMKCCAPGCYEYQLAAVARCVFSLNGCGPDAYAAIVGGGPNGCILHYSACDRRLSDDDLIVMDYAPTLAGYASDVTRTFPASGAFTPAQRKLVTDVWEIQQALLADVRPGARLGALGSRCAQMLRERGYRNDHGPCHHVGLAVHDPSTDVLEAGMVITVEPGAYLPDQGMGCRIEDTVLVTADGCEVLSQSVPSHPDAIEALMKANGFVDLTPR